MSVIPVSLSVDLVLTVSIGFISVFQTCVSSLQGSDSLTSLPVYQEVVTGLERLVLSDVLTHQDMEAVIKLAVER